MFAFKVLINSRVAGFEHVYYCYIIHISIVPYYVYYVIFQTNQVKNVNTVCNNYFFTLFR